MLMIRSHLILQAARLFNRTSYPGCMRVTEQGTLYKQMIQNMRSLCGGAQPLGMLVGVGQFL